MRVKDGINYYASEHSTLSNLKRKRLLKVPHMDGPVSSLILFFFLSPPLSFILTYDLTSQSPSLSQDIPNPLANNYLLELLTLTVCLLVSLLETRVNLLETDSSQFLLLGNVTILGT